MVFTAFMGNATEKKQKLENIFKDTSEKALVQALVHHSSYGLCLMDSSGHIEYMSPYWLSLFGYQKVETLPTCIQTFIPPLQGGYHPILDILQKAKTPKDYREILVSGMTLHSHPFTLLINISPLKVNDQTLYFLIAHPLEKIKGLGESKAQSNSFWKSVVGIEERLKETEVRFRELADKAPVHIWITDENGHCVYANEGMLQFTGNKIRPGVGTLLSLSIHPDDRKNIEKELGALIKERKEFKAVYRVKNNKGTYRWLLDQGNPRILSDGTFLGYVGTCVDITEQKNLEADLVESAAQLENKVTQRTQELAETNKKLFAAKVEAERANQTKTRFLASMSHEIRTPIAAILGFTELMQLSELSKSAQKQCLDTIVRNGKHLLTLINNIMDVSRYELDATSLHEEPFNLSTELSELTAIFSAQALEKNVSIYFRISEGVPTNLICDTTRFRQVISNLVGNAIKFTENGIITLVAHKVQSTPNGFQLEIRIRDSGIGIEEKKQAFVFDPFYQASHTNARKGAGLGLTISKALAKSLGGDLVLIRSHPGQGTEFSFTFLVKTQEGAVPVEKEIKAEKPAAPTLLTEHLKLKNKRILLVEDGKDNQLLYHEILRRVGCVVTIASTGKEALQIALENSFDLILMDIQLPEMNGYMVTEALRRKKKNMPILALTAFSLPEEKQKAIQAGCDACLVKPIPTAHLIAELEKWITS